MSSRLEASQWVECLPSMYYICLETLGLMASTHKLGVVTQTHNPSHKEVDTGRPEAEGHLCLQREFKGTLGYI